VKYGIEKKKEKSAIKKEKKEKRFCQLQQQIKDYLVWELLIFLNFFA